MIENNLPEDAVALNIVFNALANYIQAIVEYNKNITAESAELMIQRLAVRLRKAYQSRLN